MYPFNGKKKPTLLWLRLDIILNLKPHFSNKHLSKINLVLGDLIKKNSKHKLYPSLK